MRRGVLYKYILVWFSLLTLIFSGCGGGGEKAKELLLKILQLVGIPQEVVVNICQDTNENGICEAKEPKAQLLVEKDDNETTLMSKLVETEEGRYSLETL